ncbi:MAG: aspartyl/asparaginyl beta-hydroxylase domain-containing protein [Pseudomonadales bacterium]|nr:aspartyl/asparaginyl beta-hydroxylase domain-containing protein [Pseudomonadales bacterium]
MPPSLINRFSEYQYRWIKRAGKQLLRNFGEFQSRHSLVSTEPFIAKETFAWTGDLESCWETIRSDADFVLKHPEQIPAFHQMSEDQKRISKGDNWKVFAFYVFGERIEENCQLCPDTAQALDKIENLQNAFFSILAPHYHIPAHKGPTRAIIRVHLGLIIPTERDKCWLRVEDQFATWEAGKCLVFDDSYEHEVHNETDERRVVLFLDFDRPMDRWGSFVNGVIIRLLKGSKYVKHPLKNLAAWNKERRDTPAAN